MKHPSQGDPGCTEARERIHAILDGDLMDAAERQSLDRHLAGCAACRETRLELEQIQATLRDLPSVPMTGEAFDEVLARTSRLTHGRRLSRWGLDWRAAAAAAALAAALWAVWPSGPDQAEVDQAAAEVRMVLTLTAQALSRTQRAAIRGVMTDQVSPALNRVPMNMPTTPRAEDL